MKPAEWHLIAGDRPLGQKFADRIIARLTRRSSSQSERAALLLGLEARGVRSDDLADIAVAIRRRARPFPLANGRRAIDLCGCGGSARPTYNVSTVSAFVVNAAGLPVVKHGNRSSRGLTGSSDLLEALGLPVTTSRSFASATFRGFGLAFLHAPLYHRSALRVADARRAIGVPTVFNRLGPLSNPAELGSQLVGCPGTGLARTMAATLGRLGRRNAATVTSRSGRDEFDPGRPSRVFWPVKGRLETRVVDPSVLLDSEDRRGSWDGLPPKLAAREAERILAGGGGARRGSVLLTSGYALLLAGLAPSLRAGIDCATDALDTGLAERRLEDVRAIARARYRGSPP